MKTKLVLWGIKEQNDESEATERVLLAMELNPETNKVKTWLFEGAHATEELAKTLLDKWRQGEAIAFPQDVEPTEQALSAGCTLLPEGIIAEKRELITRTQTEWIFMVLSTKLFKNYRNELEELQEQVESATQYSKDLWNRMKGFWEKVQQQINEQNLFKEHINQLRSRTNELFSQLKKMRSSEDAQFESQAREQYDRLLTKLEPIEQQAEQEGADLQKIFNQLKNLQQEFKALQLTRSLRSKLWDRIDAAFKLVKKKRSPNSSPEGRLTRRIEGLKSAIEKMERSIARDQKEMDLQQKKIDSGNVSQLETQLRQVRAKLIQERIDSKNSKLTDMCATMADLQKKHERNQKRREREEAKEAARVQKEAEQKAVKAAKEAETAKKAVESKQEQPVADDSPKEEQATTTAPAEDVKEETTPPPSTVEEPAAASEELPSAQDEEE